MHNLCVVCNENSKRNWDVMLGQTVIDPQGRRKDIELTQWYASYEKVIGGAMITKKLYWIIKRLSRIIPGVFPGVFPRFCTITILNNFKSFKG